MDDERCAASLRGSDQEDQPQEQPHPLLFTGISSISPIESAFHHGTRPSRQTGRQSNDGLDLPSPPSAVRAMLRDCLR